jgi:hypothetical protein
MYELDNFAWERELWSQSEVALRPRSEISRREGTGVGPTRWKHQSTACKACSTLGKNTGFRRAPGTESEGRAGTIAQADPQFWDAYLGLGVYHYYGSMLTKAYWFLPGFGDQRQKGLNEIRQARERGSTTSESLADYALHVRPVRGESSTARPSLG